MLGTREGAGVGGGFSGYALNRQPWLIQPLRVVGTFGLDLVIMLVNCALAMAPIAILDRRRKFETKVTIIPLPAARWCGSFLLLLAVWCAIGLCTPDEDDPIVRLAVLQLGARPRELGSPPEARDRTMLGRLSAQTHEAAARGARLVVSPEAALGADPRSPTGASSRSSRGKWPQRGCRIRSPNAPAPERAVTIDPRGEFVRSVRERSPGRSFSFGVWNLSRGRTRRSTPPSAG